MDPNLLYKKFLEGKLTDGDVVELFRIIQRLQEDNELLKIVEEAYEGLKKSL